MIAILGCGLIGESWAGLMTAYGHDVILWDPAGAALVGIEERIARLRAEVVAAGGGMARGEGHVRIAPTLAEAVRDARWIQENAPEKIALKHDLYRQIEAANAVVPIASSTSSLTWSELSPALRDPGRLLTAHPFNPPHLMPLVEIYAPDAALRDRAVDFYTGLGREAVTLKKDAVGHIANRLASALWREAVHLVAEGIADVETVDRALVHGPGLRWSVIGAHMAYHLGGGPGGIRAYLEHLGPSQQRRWESLGAPSLTPEVCTLLIEGVEAEAAGRALPEIAAARDRALVRALAVRREGENDEV
ncbi:3-hydroxyacyl-CoA dehydrogenase NAD-binding domain-containing protein [Sphingomonas sp. HITSZ_GF]|uniref:3-hydroxyacyl-CoA dehydrogenase NAD-binding domain-containing protein n=1 Tax=Sphingomonas sp. HITSZ_GF TaxID=3037247 RepID=UPI00240D4782|nr:3-hydroxyacyl-CoA dehydrogenase NAD-binding domain-containing protein [Sphingomonas sp. HITSZ_GF]MDG2535936.1 3-hydroxyacyl-CoA dehydrogenase NAD-binding domain-containing protein [Sphingomonas sp. HITSZ_GF]